MAAIGPIFFPGLGIGANANVGMTSFSISANNNAIEWVFQAPEAITISRLGYRQTAVTGTSPTYRISLQGVDASGNPDGTIKASTNAYATFTPAAGTNNTWQWINIGATYTCTKGEWLAIVIDYSSGTVNASNTCTFGYIFSNYVAIGGAPYAISNTAGSRSRQVAQPIYGFGSSTTAYGRPVSAVTSVAYGSGSSPNEYAMRFKWPASSCSSFSVSGLRTVATLAAGNTIDQILYTGTTALQTVAIDTDFSGGSRTSQQTLFTDSTLSTLSPNTEYRISQKATSAGSSTFFYFDVASNDDLDAWPGGKEVYVSTRAGGAWTDVTTRRMLWDILINDMAVSGGVFILDD